MLTIRPEQFAILARLEVEKFEEWVEGHLKKFFPSQCAALGDRQLSEVVHHGIRRAKAHGITARRDVAKYIDLMVVFGRDFDTDKRLRWAGEILRRRAHPSHRMQALLQAAKRRLS